MDRAMKAYWGALVMMLGLLTIGSTVAQAAPLVDCSKPAFKRPDSARSLYLWTRGAEARIIKAKKAGVFGVKHNAMHGPGVSKDYCPQVISYRGSAHCKEPANAEYRAALARIIKVCAEAEKPVVTAKGASVDCKDPRFRHPGATLTHLLKWIDSALGGLDHLRPNEAFRVKANCDRAFKYAGTAYCKVPTDPRTRAAIDKVNKVCAAARARFAAAKTKDAAEARASVAAAKANRKVVPFPRSTYRGGGARALGAAMRKALLAGRVAKARSEVLRVQPMGRWQRGRYRGTRVPYQKVTGIVLWWDKDKDGVCRYVSYNYVKEQRGGKWTPLKVKAFCMGCPEGWTRCK
jgi:hypothetical protein